ncbi:MAG: cyclophilin-like fold protein [Lachnospiraceae bacterium]|nr:cyclophilin-like fold protein [Lachnospiraceae bacterium]
MYNGNQIVVFYGSNSWSYTKLGKVEDLTGWEEALGSGDVELVFSLQEADHE